MWKAILGLTFLGVVYCIPPPPELPPVQGNFSDAPLSPRDYEFLDELARSRRVAVTNYPSGFKYMYVGQDGRIVEDHKPSSGHWIQIVGSPHTTHSALYTASQEVGKMLRHSPSHIFTNIANHPGAGLGVFTRTEKITVFPDVASLADTPECHGRCDGSCSHTCTFDGRKYETLGGLTSTRSLVLLDNFMCTTHDPHHHIDNILVHEFAHNINRNGFTSSEKSQLTAAYNHAKSHNLWRANSYAMANQAEYFAEATGAFFMVNKQSSAGGMNECSSGHKCTSEMAARHHIQAQDPQLYNLLSHIYTNGHPTTPGGLHICP